MDYRRGDTVTPTKPPLPTAPPNVYRRDGRAVLIPISLLAAGVFLLFLLFGCVTAEPSPANMRNAPANVDPRVDGAVVYSELAGSQKAYNRIAKLCATNHGGAEWEVVSEEQFMKAEDWSGQQMTHTRIFYDCLADNGVAQ
jgi:hypothetical protein